AVPSTLKNTPTGKFTGTIPSDASEGIFEITESTYTHYNDTTQIPCTKGIATIDGFEGTTAGTPNLLFVQATDNCGNKSDWFVLRVQLDDQKPVITLDTNNPSSILTNGKSELTTLKGSVTDNGAGLKALRVYVNDTTTPAFVCGGSANHNTTQTITNDYGTMTFTANAASLSDTAPSFADATSSVSWELTLNPVKNDGTWQTWFEQIKDKTNPQIIIEAEDWAEDSSGSGNKNSDLITTLDIDILSPVASITDPDVSGDLNGKHTVKANVEEEHTIDKVAIYYSKAATAPAALSAWTKLDEKSSVYKIEKEIDLNSTTYIANNTAKGKVHILVFAKDKSGNSNVPETNVKANQSDGTPAYKTINIDKNSDRPVVTITNIDLVNSNNALSANNYLNHQTNTLNFKVEDDDGIKKDDDGIETVEYRITKEGQTWTEENPGWKPVRLVQNSGVIKFVTDDGKPSDGKQKIEFRIVDNDNTTFLSETTEGLNKIYLKDMAQSVHTYGLTNGEQGYTAAYATPSIYLNVDTQSPKVAIKGITPLKESNGTNGTEVTNGYSSLALGGPDNKYIKVRIEATDEGTGVKEVSVTAKLDGTSVTTSPAKLTSPDDDGFYYFEIPCFDSSTKKDNKQLSITVKAVDNVTKEASDSILLKVDDKQPVITINAPSDSENLSGSVTAEGSIDESVKLYYTISPIATSPDEYAQSQTFKFSKTNKNGVTTNNISLPTTDKSGATITTPYSNKLKELCGWHSLDENDNPLMSFYLWLDGKTDGSAVGYHSDTLNQWILNMGITTNEDLGSISNPFDDIVKLYFHVKAVDAAGNEKTAYREISVDPLGKRPKVNIGYPVDPEDGSILTLGGTPTIIGTAQGANTVDYVWMQLDCTGDKKWTIADFNKLVALNYGNTPYTLGNMKTKAVVTSNISSNPENYAIRISLSGLSWSQKINLGNELYPEIGNTQDVKIWVYATDNQNFTSNEEVREFKMDKDSPVIDQNLILVQWNNTYSGNNGFTVDNTGAITFADGAVKASRAYQENLNIKGKWFLIGKVSDAGSGIKNITYRVNNGTTVNAVTTNGSTHSESTTGAYIKKYGSANKYNYVFC
ncbi:MAG: hypothetical protein IKN54_08200, partial [Lachnospiraceae bacterium]|nr:hypothetical protein [Lachnospiraceae bacterium]